MQINSLYFDAELLEDDFRRLLRSEFRNKEAIALFNEIYLIPVEQDFTPKTNLPAVSIEVQKSGTYNQAQEDIQVDPYSRFDVVIETYTTGEDKRSKNRKLAQFIINTLQTNQQLGHYYNRGLTLDNEMELSSVVSGVNRRRVRLSAVVDNELKLILNKV